MDLPDVNFTVYSVIYMQVNKR